LIIIFPAEGVGVLLTVLGVSLAASSTALRAGRGRHHPFPLHGLRGLVVRMILGYRLEISRHLLLQMLFLLAVLIEMVGMREE